MVLENLLFNWNILSLGLIAFGFFHQFLLPAAGGIGGFLLGGPAGALTGAGLGASLAGGGDFLTGTEGELTEEQRRALEAIQALQGDISGRIGEIQDRPVLDAATINAIRSITGGVAASTGSALGARLAGQGTLGGGIGNQALAQIEGQRQTSLSNALAQAALQGRGQNLAFESSLFGQQAGLLGQQATLAGQFRPDTPGLLQGLLPGIGQAVGAGGFNAPDLGFLSGLFGGGGGGSNSGIPQSLKIPPLNIPAFPNF